MCESSNEQSANRGRTEGAAASQCSGVQAVGQRQCCQTTPLFESMISGVNHTSLLLVTNGFWLGLSPSWVRTVAIICLHARLEKHT